MSKCNICKNEMTEAENCGGDCVYCMAEAGDPDCLKALLSNLKDFACTFSVDYENSMFTDDHHEYYEEFEKFIKTIHERMTLP